MTVDIYTVYT